MAGTPVKVLLVEDSPVAMEIIKRLLDASPEVEVVGTAGNGAAALTQVANKDPDVILTDLQMPGMDGYEFTQQVMQQYPRPIMVVSNTVQPTDVDNIFTLMKYGALDFFPKPTTGSPTDYEKLQGMLVTKIKVLASKRV
ncbi:MAG: response regulator [Cyanobacteria bacterium J06641_5]